MGGDSRGCLSTTEGTAKKWISMDDIQDGGMFQEGLLTFADGFQGFREK
jgi:hypothetical protein